MRWRLASSSASTCEIRVRTADWSPSLDSRSLASAWILARWYRLWMLAACDCCSSSSLFRRTFRLARSASAPSQLQLGVEHLLQHALVAQLEDDRVGLDDVGARQRDDALDRGLGGRSDPPDVLGHERARSADLPEHRTALGRVAPGRRSLHSGRRRLQLREADGDQHADQQGGHAEDDALDLFLLRDRR